MPMEYRLIFQAWRENDVQAFPWEDRAVVQGNARTIIAAADDIIDQLLEEGFNPIKTHEEAQEYIDRVFKRSDRVRNERRGASPTD